MHDTDGFGKQTQTPRPDCQSGILRGYQHCPRPQSLPICPQQPRPAVERCSMARRCPTSGNSRDTPGTRLGGHSSSLPLVHCTLPRESSGACRAAASSSTTTFPGYRGPGGPMPQKHDFIQCSNGAPLSSSASHPSQQKEREPQ